MAEPNIATESLRADEGTSSKLKHPAVWITVIAIAIAGGMYAVVNSGPKKTTDLLPMYGETDPNSPKLEDERQAAESLAQKAGGKDAAAAEQAKRGWQFIEDGDPDRAMRTFNQAWLLNPKDGRVYWGFATILANRGRLAQAILHYEEAIKYEPSNLRLINDWLHTRARRIAAAQNPQERKQLITETLTFCAAAAKLDPNYADTYANLAIVHFYDGNYKAAWESVNKARSIDKEAVDPRFVDELQKKAPAS